jgi:hypothetical protein
MDWHELSEINFGLMWEGRRDVSEYTPDMFDKPYDEAVKILSRKGATREDVAKKINPNALQNAHTSVANMNGLGEPENCDWKSMLLGARIAKDRGRMLKHVGEKLERNEDVDLLPVYGDLTSAVAGQASGLTVATEIDYKNYKPFIKSGYKPFDTILGGIPADGPIVIYGLMGVGKSHCAAKQTTSLLHQYKKWTGAVYTLEMSAEHYLNREIAMYPDLGDVLDRLHVSGSVRNIEELVAEISTKRVNFVVIDDMAGLVEDDSASSYQKVYKRIREICRFIKIPVFVLAQPNRMAKLSNRFLRPFDIAWSGGGEDAAALLIALQHTNALDMDDPQFEHILDDDDKEFMVFWKSRDGWPNPNQQGPGAIRLEPSKDGALWSGEVWMNKLWRPGAMKKKAMKTNR